MMKEFFIFESEGQTSKSTSSLSYLFDSQAKKVAMSDQLDSGH